MCSRACWVVQGSIWRGGRDPARVSASTWANRLGQAGAAAVADPPLTGPPFTGTPFTGLSVAGPLVVCRPPSGSPEGT